MTGGPATGLRIAATTLPPIADAVVDPICAGAVQEAAELLRSLGHTVEEVEPPWQLEGIRSCSGASSSSHIALSIAYSRCCVPVASRPLRTWSR